MIQGAEADYFIRMYPLFFNICMERGTGTKEHPKRRLIVYIQWRDAMNALALV